MSKSIFYSMLMDNIYSNIDEKKRVEVNSTEGPFSPPTVDSIKFLVSLNIFIFTKGSSCNIFIFSD